MNVAKLMATSPRWWFATTATICAALLAFGYYLQFVEGLEPCPMCVFQRLCYFAVIAITFAGAVHGPRRRAVFVYAGLTAIGAGVGGAIAARQVWLQHLPPELVPECGPGLEFMLEMYPLADVIRHGLVGTGDCAEVDWTFLSLSIAEWSLLCFAAIVVSSLALGVLHGRRWNESTR